MSNNNVLRILTGLDELLDTRFGTLRRMGEEVLARAMENGYRQRIQDRFDGVDPEQFKEMYAKRDRETLAASYVSNHPAYLLRMVAELTEQTIVRPYQDAVLVQVNVWPYYTSTQGKNELEAEELQQLLLCIKSVWLRDVVPVELVCIRPEELTLSYCKGNLATLFMYDYGSWLRLHRSAFEQIIIPEVTLIGPRIFFEEPPSAEQVQELVDEISREFGDAAAEKVRDFRDAFVITSAPMIALHLVDVDMFNLYQPPTGKAA